MRFKETSLLSSYKSCLNRCKIDYNKNRNCLVTKQRTQNIIKRCYNIIINWKPLTRNSEIVYKVKICTTEWPQWPPRGRHEDRLLHWACLFVKIPEKFSRKKCLLFFGRTLSRCPDLTVTNRTNDFKIGRRHRDARDASQSGKRHVLRIFEVKNVKKWGEEKEKFFLSQVVAETHPLANSKRHEVFWLVDRFLVLREESFWPECLGLVPVVWVHVNGMEQWNDVSIFGNDVSFKVDRPAMERKKKLVYPIEF